MTHCSWSEVQCSDTIITTCDGVYPPPHLRLVLLLSGDVELNPGPITGKHALNTTLINWYTTVGNPRDILRSYFADLVDAITNNLHRITNGLYSKGLVPQHALDYVLVLGLDDYTKAKKLFHTIQRHLEASLTPDQYLSDICHVLILINQQDLTLTDIATNILHQLGEYNVCTLMSMYCCIAIKFGSEFVIFAMTGWSRCACMMSHHTCK